MALPASESPPAHRGDFSCKALVLRSEVTSQISIGEAGSLRFMPSARAEGALPLTKNSG